MTQALLRDPGIPEQTIQADVDRGVVTLTGRVASLLEKRRAQALLEQVRGVRSVINRIDVHPTAVAGDSTLAERVRSALRRDRAIDTSQMRVEVVNGHVSLHGSARSAAEIQLARGAAESAIGVRGVTSQLALRELAARSDAEIVAEVKALLAADPWVHDGLIRVTVEDGVVTLTGTVGLISERNRAAAKAWVRGVRGVQIAGLEVEPWAREPGRRDEPTPYVPPAQLAHNVKLALYYDPRVSSERIDVAVDGASVVLTGVAENQRARRAAEQDANATVGVAKVENRIDVEPPPHADDAIAMRLREAIEGHPFLADDPIQVSVQRGTARLTGTVDNLLESRTADQLAFDVAGATAVLNQLAVREQEKGLAARPLDPVLDSAEPLGVFPRPSTRQDIPGQGMRASNELALALARCQQQQRCGFVARGSKYESMDACTEELLAREQHQLSRFSCPTSTERSRLEQCLVAVRTLDCALPFVASLQDPSCDAGRLCDGFD